MRRFIVLTVVLLIVFACGVAFAETIDKVVAYIDDNAITLRELEAQQARLGGADRDTALESLINTRLMLLDANRLRLEADTEDGLLIKYLDLKVRPQVSVTEQEIKDYYKANIKDVPLKKARPEIEKYLFELKYNEALRKHIESLRKDSLIRVLETP